MVIGALWLAAAAAQDEPPVVIDETAPQEERWASVVTGRTQVLAWPVEGTATSGEDVEGIDTFYVALEAGNGLRVAATAHPVLSLGFEAGWGLTLIGAGPGPPLGIGIDLAPMVALGADGAHTERPPVGVILAAGVRVDGALLSGVARVGSTHWTVLVRPFGSAEAIVRVAPILVGLRAEYALPGRSRRESFGNVTDVTVGRFGGGFVFRLPF